MGPRGVGPAVNSSLEEMSVCSGLRISTEVEGGREGRGCPCKVSRDFFEETPSLFKASLNLWAPDSTTVDATAGTSPVSGEGSSCWPEKGAS
jgi:hypothetical protein